MDAFAGYNQIQMEEEDQEKMAFIISRGLFCYKAMPFGLKNAGATYQLLVNKMFYDQIGRNVEVYVDDMLIKSKENEDHLADLKETLRQISWLHGVSTRDRGQPGQNQGHPRDEPSKDRQRGLEPHGKDNRSK